MAGEESGAGGGEKMNMDGFTWLKFVGFLVACVVIAVPLFLLVLRVVVEFAFWIDDIIERIFW